jgi:hypothetical protein
MICEKPLKSAKKPTQNRIKAVRWARAYTRSEPDTQNANRTSRIPETRNSHQYRAASRAINRSPVSNFASLMFDSVQSLRATRACAECRDCG